MRADKNNIETELLRRRRGPCRRGPAHLAALEYISEAPGNGANANDCSCAALLEIIKNIIMGLTDV